MFSLSKSNDRDVLKWGLKNKIGVTLNFLTSVSCVWLMHKNLHMLGRAMFLTSKLWPGFTYASPAMRWDGGSSAYRHSRLWLSVCRKFTHHVCILPISMLTNTPHWKYMYNLRAGGHQCKVQWVCYRIGHLNLCKFVNQCHPDKFNEKVKNQKKYMYINYVPLTAVKSTSQALHISFSGSKNWISRVLKIILKLSPQHSLKYTW